MVKESSSTHSTHSTLRTFHAYFSLCFQRCIHYKCLLCRTTQSAHYSPKIYHYLCRFIWLNKYPRSVVLLFVANNSLADIYLELQPHSPFDFNFIIEVVSLPIKCWSRRNGVNWNKCIRDNIGREYICRCRSYQYAMTVNTWIVKTFPYWLPNAVNVPLFNWSCFYSSECLRDTIFSILLRHYNPSQEIVGSGWRQIETYLSMAETPKSIIEYLAIGQWDGTSGWWWLFRLAREKMCVGWSDDTSLGHCCKGKLLQFECSEL